MDENQAVEARDVSTQEDPQDDLDICGTDCMCPACTYVWLAIAIVAIAYWILTSL